MFIKKKRHTKNIPIVIVSFKFIISMFPLCCCIRERIFFSYIKFTFYYKTYNIYENVRWEAITSLNTFCFTREREDKVCVCAIIYIFFVKLRMKRINNNSKEQEAVVFFLLLNKTEILFFLCAHISDRCLFLLLLLHMSLHVYFMFVVQHTRHQL